MTQIAEILTFFQKIFPTEPYGFANNFFYCLDQITFKRIEVSLNEFKNILFSKSFNAKQL